MRPKKHHIEPAALAVVVLSLTITNFVCAEVRVWTDTQGRTVSAEYAGVDAGKVKLKLANGKIVPFPYSKLSPEDQKWVKDGFLSSPENVANRIDQYIAEGLKQANRAPNPGTTDAQFVRRIYLEITGRIPTYDETILFLDSTAPNKRKGLIDQLLDSNEYVSHTFNWYADQLRVTSRTKDYAVFETYIQWIKDSIAEDLPWDQFVRAMIESEGTIFEDPASGWFLRDFGMPLNNLSATVSLFLGTEITCAQCHDHPFEEWTQMDFYSLAAFLGQKTERVGVKWKDYIGERDRIEQQVRELKGDPNFGFDNRIRLVMGFNQQAIGDSEEKQLALPHDYKYDDGKPGEVVEPYTLFGEDIDVSDYETPRKAFSAWLTSPENPRFSVALVNRVWDWAFGLPLHNPVDNLANLKQAQNPELLAFLAESFGKMNFSIKDLRRAIYYSEAWQREATPEGVSEIEIGRNDYPFPGPVLRRMSAEQLWDSFMTLLVTDPYDLKRDVADDVRRSIEMDYASIEGETALKKVELASDLVRKAISGPAPSLHAVPENPTGKAYRENGDLLRDYGTYFVRASEMRQPASGDHFLRAWGQADRTTPDNGSDQGSVPQILYILNSYMSHSLAKPDSMIFKKAGGVRATGEKLDQIYLSILNRPAEGKEKAVCYKAIRSDEKNGYPDLIWALINSREFLFIQ
ncbi:MAG: DUF1549 domain-containing protein [Verrucomicrobiales bacterium]|nr:DUF1549 domain-containing protein [Verrucomicrobiales bacterium]